VVLELQVIDLVAVLVSLIQQTVHGVHTVITGTLELVLVLQQTELS
jgi:hypothetical protein